MSLTLYYQPPTPEPHLQFQTNSTNAAWLTNESRPKPLLDLIWEPSSGKNDVMTVLFLLNLLSFLTALSSFTSADPSDYHEGLVLQPLPQSSLLASFNFRSNTSQEAFEQHHFRYFPRALGQILQHAHTKELHLRFTTGRWDAESWGSRPWNGTKEGSTGVELWAWIDAPDNDGWVLSPW